MERPRARSRIATVTIAAIAAAIAASAGGLFEAPGNLTPGPDRVAARVVTPLADATTPPAVEEHHEPTPSPSTTPPPAASGTPDRHEMDAGSSGDPHVMDDPTHDEDGAMPGMDDEEMGSHEPSAGHEDASGGHEDASGDQEGAAGGHGDEEPAGERPQAVVLGGFLAINAVALVAAAILRRRDGAAAALTAAQTLSTSTKKVTPR